MNILSDQCSSDGGCCRGAMGAVFDENRNGDDRIFSRCIADEPGMIPEIKIQVFRLQLITAFNAEYLGGSCFSGNLYMLQPDSFGCSPIRFNHVQKPFLKNLQGF